VLETVLILAAAAAGVTGAWSPCGFSMVETLAPHGYAGRLRTTIAACLTFSAGALVGGVVTFGGLSLLGQALGAGGPVALAVAAAIAFVAAIGEARGARILPQVRRQVPESWRRRLPVPLAAGLYGVLLGLGFTTFILTFAVWTLAGVSVAVGDPSLGIAVGLAFGAGRLLPVIVLAPAGETEWGAAAHAAMAERPRILRSLRAIDAVTMVACAIVLVSV
jgi:cytochrome c-type biogenesis protein